MHSSSIYVQRFQMFARQYPLVIYWFFRSSSEMRRMFEVDQLRSFSRLSAYKVFGFTQLLHFSVNETQTFKRPYRSVRQRSTYAIVLHRSLYRRVILQPYQNKLLQEALNVIAHEIAHCLHIYLCGVSQPEHGSEWRRIARLLGCTDDESSHQCMVFLHQ